MYTETKTDKIIMKQIAFLFTIIFFNFSCSTPNDEQDVLYKRNKEFLDSMPKCEELLKQFNTVYLAASHKLVLGNSIDSVKQIVNRINPEYYSLKRNAFGIADSMAMEVNKDHRIISIVAAYEYAPEYSNDTAYIHELKKYQAMLCSNGKNYDYKKKDTSFTVTQWTAGNIIFELIEERLNEKAKCYSVIFDKELYSEKLRNLRLETQNISFEIQNRLNRPLR